MSNTTCKLADSCQQIINSRDKEIERKEEEIENLKEVIENQKKQRVGYENIFNRTGWVVDNSFSSF